MAVFTVFLPPAPEGAIPPPEKIVFLRDAFSWPAFVFGPLWLAWRRAFAAAGASFVVLVALSLALSALQLPAGGTWELEVLAETATGQTRFATTFTVG